MIQEVLFSLHFDAYNDHSDFIPHFSDSVLQVQIFLPYSLLYQTVVFWEPPLLEERAGVRYFYEISLSHA